MVSPLELIFKVKLKLMIGFWQHRSQWIFDQMEFPSPISYINGVEGEVSQTFTGHYKLLLKKIIFAF